MDFDDQLRRHFGTTDLETLSPDAIAAGVERMRVEFGLEKDRSRRFALWTLLPMRGGAPARDVACADEAVRAAARAVRDMIDAAAED